MEEIKNECFVVLDTNVLLVPYTVSKTSLQAIRNAYLQLIELKRLVVPGQVAREFAKNRPNKISALLSADFKQKRFSKIYEVGILSSF